MKRKGKGNNTFLGGILYFLLSSVIGIILCWGIITFGDARPQNDQQKSTSQSTSDTTADPSTQTTETLSTENTSEQISTEKATDDAGWVVVDEDGNPVEDQTEDKSKDSDKEKNKDEKDGTENTSEDGNNASTEAGSEDVTETATEVKAAAVAGLTEANPATSRYQFAEAVRYQLLNTDQDDITLYTKGIDEKACFELNYFLDSTYGKSRQYVFQPMTNDMAKVTLTTEKSESYYVYQNIVNGKPIPNEEIQATTMAGVVRQIIDENVNTSMSEYEKELALHDYMIYHCHYGDDDRNKASYHTAYGVLVDQVAVCQGYAYAFELLLNCVGVDCRYIVGDAGDPAESHAWNQVCIDGKWYNVDSTWDDPVAEELVANEGYLFFNISDDYLSKLQHTWIREDYRECTDMDMNYFNVNGVLFDNYDQYNEALKKAVSENVKSFDAAVLDYSTSKYDFEKMVPNAGYYGRYTYYWGTNIDTEYQEIRIDFE